MSQCIGEECTHSSHKDEKNMESEDHKRWKKWREELKNQPGNRAWRRKKLKKL